MAAFSWAVRRRCRRAQMLASADCVASTARGALSRSPPSPSALPPVRGVLAIAFSASPALPLCHPPTRVGPVLPRRERATHAPHAHVRAARHRDRPLPPPPSCSCCCCSSSFGRPAALVECRARLYHCSCASGGRVFDVQCAARPKAPTPMEPAPERAADVGDGGQSTAATDLTVSHVVAAAVSTAEPRSRLSAVLDGLVPPLAAAGEAERAAVDDIASPLPSGAADTHTSGMCVECEDQPAGLQCLQCGDDYCEVCFLDQHRRGKRAQHTYAPLPGARISLDVSARHFSMPVPPAVAADGRPATVPMPAPAPVEAEKGVGGEAAIEVQPIADSVVPPAEGAPDAESSPLETSGMSSNSDTASREGGYFSDDDSDGDVAASGVSASADHTRASDRKLPRMASGDESTGRAVGMHSDYDRTAPYALGGDVRIGASVVAAGDIVERAKYIPMRLSLEERKLLRLVEAAAGGACAAGVAALCAACPHVRSLLMCAIAACDQ